jgi:glutamate formiminotransferase / formiminotetrahydrofolate cyclodeaminase
MNQIVECVPNFSEGRNKDKIKAITDVIEAVPGVVLLDVDPGAATNRTVVTFVGEPENVKEAAFMAISKAAEVIDMSQHSGEHARMGATDVCPFVPVKGLTMEDCANIAAELGERVGRELNIPVYLYENAAREEKRRNLATVRAGEYEALGTKLTDPDWKPDFGPAEFGEYQQKTGATAISARQFLIAWNFNFNSKDPKLAHDVALTVREKGRWKRDSAGKMVRDDKNKKVRQEGLLKCTKAVGWYIDEYKRAQVSMNLTDYTVTPLYKAFDTVSDVAAANGLRVTGAEIVGLVPLESLLDSGRYYLAKQGKSRGVSDLDLLDCAINSMGLSELYKFDPEDKIIDYRVQQRSGRLVDLRITEFADLLASDEPAPGGGSTAALCGCLAAALAAMVANLTHGKKGYTEHNAEMDEIALSGQKYKAKFSMLIDQDTLAFNDVMAAMKLPKKSDAEKACRLKAIDGANKIATLIPFQVVETCLEVIGLIDAVAVRGNQNSLSDAGVAALALGTACDGAAMNVRINLQGIEDRKWALDLDAKTKELQDKLHSARAKVLKFVETKLQVS